jgi:hypothetical protein
VNELEEEPEPHAYERLPGKDGEGWLSSVDDEIRKDDPYVLLTCTNAYTDKHSSLFSFLNKNTHISTYLT